MQSDAQQAYWFIFKNDHMLIANNEKKANKLINREAYSELGHCIVRQHELASADGATFYCAELQTDLPKNDNLELVPFRKALEMLDPSWYNLAVKAYEIVNWDKNHQYCGRCGSETSETTEPSERICPTCELTFYPRISPSIIVLIKKEDNILMARGYQFAPGSYGLIAGFVEAGENIEDAVHREVWEEVGIRIKNLRYFGSQAWPFPDSLMIAFIADYESGEITIDTEEIEAADWYPLTQLPHRTASSISIARKLIDHVLAEANK